MLGRIRCRGKDGTDRPRHRIVIAVTTTPSIHGARVHAGSATNAVQRSAKVVRRQNVAAAIVDDHNVQFSLSFALPSRLWTVKVSRVRGDWLSGCRTCEQAQEYTEVTRSGDELLDPHTGNVQIGKRRADVRVPFVRADDEAARLRDGEVDARDARFSCEELAS